MREEQEQGWKGRGENKQQQLETFRQQIDFWDFCLAHSIRTSTILKENSKRAQTGSGSAKETAFSFNRIWSLYLLVGLTDPYNHTYSESLWWKLFKNHKRTQIQRQRQWQRQRQRQRHRQSAWKTQHMLYFWNPDDLLSPNMMIDTSPWSSCSRRSPWLPCSSHRISSTGPSVSPFRDFSTGDRELWILL